MSRFNRFQNPSLENTHLFEMPTQEIVTALSAIQRRNERFQEREDHLNDLLSNVKSLDPDNSYVQDIISGYNSEIDSLVEEYDELNPANSTRKIRNLTSKIQSDVQSGNLFKANKAYEDFNTRLAEIEKNPNFSPTQKAFLRGSALNQYEARGALQGKQDINSFIANPRKHTDTLDYVNSIGANYRHDGSGWIKDVQNADGTITTHRFETKELAEADLERFIRDDVSSDWMLERSEQYQQGILSGQLGVEDAQGMMSAEVKSAIDMARNKFGFKQTSGGRTIKADPTVSQADREALNTPQFIQPSPTSTREVEKGRTDVLTTSMATRKLQSAGYAPTGNPYLDLKLAVSKGAMSLNDMFSNEELLNSMASQRSDWNTLSPMMKREMMRSEFNGMLKQATTAKDIMPRERKALDLKDDNISRTNNMRFIITRPSGEIVEKNMSLIDAANDPELRQYMKMEGVLDFNLNTEYDEDLEASVVKGTDLTPQDIRETYNNFKTPADISAFKQDYPEDDGAWTQKSPSEYTQSVANGFSFDGRNWQTLQEGTLGYDGKYKETNSYFVEEELIDASGQNFSVKIVTDLVKLPRE